MRRKGRTPIVVKFFSESFRRHVVEEIEKGELTAAEAQRRYRIAKTNALFREVARRNIVAEMEPMEMWTSPADRRSAGIDNPVTIAA